MISRLQRGCPPCPCVDVVQVDVFQVDVVQVDVVQVDVVQVDGFQFEVNVEVVHGDRAAGSVFYCQIGDSAAREKSVSPKK